MRSEIYKQMRHAIKLCWDDYDPWGSAMSVFFDLCAAIEVRGMIVPAEFEYRSGLGGPHIEPDVVYFEEMMACPYDELVALGHVLDRLCDKLKAAGRDY